MILQAVEYESEQDKALDDFFQSTKGKFQTDLGKSWAAEIIKRRPTRKWTDTQLAVESPHAHHSVIPWLWKHRLIASIAFLESYHSGAYDLSGLSLINWYFYVSWISLTKQCCPCKLHMAVEDQRLCKSGRCSCRSTIETWNLYICFVFQLSGIISTWSTFASSTGQRSNLHWIAWFTYLIFKCKLKLFMKNSSCNRDIHQVTMHLVLNLVKKGSRVENESNRTARGWKWIRSWQNKNKKSKCST